VFVLVCRGKGGTARAELGEAARFEKMPLSAEVELREEHLELLSLDLAVLSPESQRGVPVEEGVLLAGEAGGGRIASRVLIWPPALVLVRRVCTLICTGIYADARGGTSLNEQHRAIVESTK
jgi:hypothetical protein